jgi:hypothetical protein
MNPSRWEACAVTSVYYEIRVTGILPPEALLDFERLTVAVGRIETVVHGTLRDQAALSGLLARLAASGIEIVALRRFPWFEPASCERAIPDVTAADPPTVRFPGAA